MKGDANALAVFVSVRVRHNIFSNWNVRISELTSLFSKLDNLNSERNIIISEIRQSNFGNVKEKGLKHHFEATFSSLPATCSLDRRLHDTGGGGHSPPGVLDKNVKKR